MRYFATGCLSLLLWAAPANGAWLEASSDHFVIYGEQDEKTVRGFAQRLEQFHAAMAHVLGRQLDKPSPSNRVTVFVVSNKDKVRALAHIDSRYIAGVYKPRAGGSVAVVPKLKAASSEFELSGATVLYHEYAHHFMAGLTARAYPRWFVEGFAEFFAGVTFRSDGRVGFGAAPMHRAVELALAPEVPIRSLIAFDGGAVAVSPGQDSFYGQSWALFHYLHFASEREGQLAKYQQRLAAGDSALEAAEGAFGDLDRLEKDVEAYTNRRKLSVMMIDPKHLAVGEIALRTLGPAEAEMMPVMMQSKTGVTHEEALQLLAEARRIAAKYPDDPAVLTALAESEFDADFWDAAIAAADRALALDANRINAHIQKGYAMFSKAQSVASTPEATSDAWKGVRGQFLKANKVENDHPVPLLWFYSSYLAQGEPPSRNAVSGLEWAMQLAPFDPSLRWLVVQQMIRDERLKEAAQTIAPLAYSPHPGEHTEQARRTLQEIEARIAGAATTDGSEPTIDARSAD